MNRAELLWLVATKPGPVVIIAVVGGAIVFAAAQAHRERVRRAKATQLWLEQR